ncbi:MAG: DUF935 family protein [Phycisphaerales bacterium]|nr:DUF935 family protein [Phycisphaerales bacterium]MCB9855278.1 DUF935 family protein [Phycisphaerales bacterium]MCB9862871.1 DUF935 family protein [Phycisphaerales bacterium]
MAFSLGIFRRKANLKAPKPGVTIVAPEASQADYFAGDITPKKLKAVLRTAAEGDPRDQSQLFDTMLDRDGHLRSVYETRLLGINGLDWELVPANEIGKHPKINEGTAQRVHEYCAEVLASIFGFDDALSHLSDAIGRGVMAAEVEYQGQVPVAIHPIESILLTGDKDDQRRLRIVTDDNTDGELIDEYPLGKFIVHSPKTIGGSRFRGGLLRPALFPFMMKRYGLKYWQIGIELFGLPMTIAKYGEASDTKVRSELTAMLKTLGLNRGGIFPVGCELEIKEFNQPGAWPHERMLKYCDAEFSKEFLGQTLTTEIGETGGAKAAAVVHDEVREDLRDSDIRNEGATIREQLLVPMAIREFGEDGRLHAPYFRRVIEEARDLLATADLLDKAVNRLGAKIPKSVVEDELGVRLIDDEDRDEPLPGATTSSPFGEFPGPNRDSVLMSPHRALETIVRRRRSSASKLASWLFAAVAMSMAHTENVLGAVSDFVSRRRDLPTALADLPQVFDELPTDEMSAMQEQFILASRMSGMLMTRTKIERRTNRETLAVHSGRIIVPQAEFNFDSIPFVEAIDALRERLDLNPVAFERLDTEARSRAFRVAAVWDMQLLSQIHTELAASIEAGETARDFKLRLPQMADRNGWSGENPWHADLVQFQNFASSHGAGRYEQYGDYGIERWRFVANGDSCPICSPVIGKIFLLIDRRFFPPLHFLCDCEDEAVFEDEFAGEFDDSRRFDHPAYDKYIAKPSAYRWDPASYAKLEPLNLSSIVPELQPRFRAVAERFGWEVIE